MIGGHPEGLSRETANNGGGYWTVRATCAVAYEAVFVHALFDLANPSASRRWTRPASLVRGSDTPAQPTPFSVYSICGANPHSHPATTSP